MAISGWVMVQVNPDFKKRLDAIPDAIRKAAARELERGAEEMVQEMRRLAPRDPKPDGIHLADHIGWTWGDAPAGSFTLGEVNTGPNAGAEYAALRITIYANPKDAKGRAYASWVEFGTRRSAASAFFWPAYRLHRRRIRSRIRKAIKEALTNG